MSENAGGEAFVVGPEQAVTGVVGVANGVAAGVDGAEQTVTGVVAVADGVSANVFRFEQAVTGVLLARWCCRGGEWIRGQRNRCVGRPDAAD